MEALKSCSRTGTPDVAIAQQGRSTSMKPLTTVCSAPLAPTTYNMTPLDKLIENLLIEAIGSGYHFEFNLMNKEDKDTHLHMV